MNFRAKYLWFAFIITLLFISCVSSKNIIKRGALCGVIVDEDNKPVSDFIIYCSKNGAYKQSTITNESGIFVFPDMNLGTYFFEGEKIDFLKLNRQEHNFNNCSSFICIQVMSLKKCMEIINNFIKLNEFQKGVDLLNNLSVKKGTLNEVIYFSYSAYLNYMLGNYEVYAENIDILKQLKNDKSELFITCMEDLIYE